MDESESRVEMAATAQSPVDVLVSQRILDSPAEFTRWAAQHDRLMRTISSHNRLAEQMVALRSAVFALVHRRALFEYFRERKVVAWKRRRLFAVFYGCADYTNAVLLEHGNYVRSTSSYLCAQYLAEHLMHDPALDEPLSLYEEWYSEYFHAFCDVELADSEEEKQACLAQESLKPFLKQRVVEARRAILALPLTAHEWREVSRRRPTGDTQQIRALALFERPLELFEQH
jgi:hypothetical protein